VLRNTFLPQIRTAGRRPRTGARPIEEIDPMDPRTGDRPEEALQAREIFTVIAGLPERYRLALVAVDIAGLSYREAAVVLETREATIATRVFRARQQVTRKLEGSPEADLAGRRELERELAGGLEPTGEEEQPAAGAKTPRATAPSAAHEPALGDSPAEMQPAPEAPAPEALHPQREGRQGRRRLMQRGNR
jgi:hypothetical protein